MRLEEDRMMFHMLGGGRWLFRIILIVVAVIFLWIFVRNAKIDEVEDNNRRAWVMPVPRREVERVTISVYYEALCPDSRSFVLRQLEPTFETISEHVIVQFVPYGKASTNWSPTDGYTFNCQHGPKECEANTLHACVIDEVKDPSQQIKFISCMIDYNAYPQNITRTCAERLKINPEPIFNCFKSTKGSELLAEYGKMTHSLRPPVSFIPTITLDGDSSNQIEILKGLLREVCKKYKKVPAGCHQH